MRGKPKALLWPSTPHNIHTPFLLLEIGVRSIESLARGMAISPFHNTSRIGVDTTWHVLSGPCCRELIASFRSSPPRYSLEEKVYVREYFTRYGSSDLPSEIWHPQRRTRVIYAHKGSPGYAALEAYTNNSLTTRCPSHCCPRLPRPAFVSVMAKVPDGSAVVFILGEIDCREGILVAVEKLRYGTPEEGVEHTVRIFIKVSRADGIPSHPQLGGARTTRHKLCLPRWIIEVRGG